jgi:hypothetical protein
MKSTLSKIFFAVLATALVVYFFMMVWKLSNNSMSEGFAGPAKVGIPDCLQESSTAAKLYSIVASKKQTTEEGPDDLREFALILSKTSCLKKDLLSQSGFVEATRYQVYSTAHDIEPVAETTARCLAKTIPERDLDISLEKWSTRGKLLLKRLCSSTELSDAQIKETNILFKEHMDDVIDIAKSMCLKGPVEIAGTSGPRDVAAYTPPELEELREYKGYY